MAINNISGKKVKALPYDENRKPLSGIVLPIVDVDGNIIGWAPLAATDNGDGTVALKVDTELTIDTATFNISNIKVGSTDQTAGNARYLKTEEDGTLVITGDITTSTDINIEKWGGTAQTGADLTPLFQHLDVDLSTRASETTLAAVKTDLDSILAQLDVALSTRASESTLADIKDELDTVEAKLQSIIDNTDTLEVNTDTLEAKLQSVRDQLDVLLSTRASESTLSSLNSKDFATQTTLALIKAKTDNLDVLLSTIASQATLALIKAKTDNLDTALSSRASESTLSGVKSALDNVISTANSTATPLGISGTFVGTAEDVSQYGTISVFVFSDVASAANGFKIQYSTDGTNWDDDDSYTVPASNGKFFTFSPEARYFRINYTNGTSAQSSFRLQVVLKAKHTKPSSHRADDLIEESSDAELVRAVVSDILVTLSGEEKSFFGSVEVNLATGGAENKAILIRNPSGSGKNLLIGLIVLDMLTKGGQATIRLYKDPTVTAVGTAVTPVVSKIGGATTSVMNLYSAPTTSANGTRIITFSVGKDANSLPLDLKFGIDLTPGHDILITGNPDANNRVIAVTAQWVEV